MTSPSPESATAPASAADTAEALATRAAVRWWQATALLEVHGPDALTFLDGMCTQAVTRIAEGEAALGLYLDAKAKIIAPAMMWRVQDAAWTDPKRGDVTDAAPRLFLEVPADRVEPLRTHLRKYRLRAKVELEPSADTALLLLAGPASRERVDALGLDTPQLSSIEQDDTAHVALFVPATDSSGVLDALAADGVMLADCDTWEALRMARGSAGLHDLLIGRMPAEVGGVERGVSFDAGCYIGQEPVVRLHNRGRANRTLRRVEATSEVRPEPPADDSPEAFEAMLELRDPSSESSRPAGRLTTWARHPDGRVIGLAVVRREVAAGTALELPGTGGTVVVSDEAPEG